MNKLLELFKQRSELFHDETAAILEALQPTLTGIVDFLHVHPDDVSWESVELIDDIVVLVLKCPITSPQTVDDLESVRLITVGVPFNLAATASKEQIIEFLSKAQKQKIIRGEQSAVLENNVDNQNKMTDTSEVEDWLIKKAYSERKTKSKKELH